MSTLNGMLRHKHTRTYVTNIRMQWNWNKYGEILDIGHHKPSEYYLVSIVTDNPVFQLKKLSKTFVPYVQVQRTKTKCACVWTIESDERAELSMWICNQAPQHFQIRICACSVCVCVGRAWHFFFFWRIRYSYWRLLCCRRSQLEGNEIKRSQLTYIKSEFFLFCFTKNLNASNCSKWWKLSEKFISFASKSGYGFFIYLFFIRCVLVRSISSILCGMLFLIKCKYLLSEMVFSFLSCLYLCIKMLNAVYVRCTMSSHILCVVSLFPFTVTTMSTACKSNRYFKRRAHISSLSSVIFSFFLSFFLPPPIRFFCFLFAFLLHLCASLFRKINSSCKAFRSFCSLFCIAFELEKKVESEIPSICV